VAARGTERAIALLGGELGRGPAENALWWQSEVLRGRWRCLLVNLDDSDWEVAARGTERAIALLGGELGRGPAENALRWQSEVLRGRSPCLVVNLVDSDWSWLRGFRRA